MKKFFSKLFGNLFLKKEQNIGQLFIPKKREKVVTSENDIIDETNELIIASMLNGEGSVDLDYTLPLYAVDYFNDKGFTLSSHEVEIMVKNEEGKEVPQILKKTKIIW